MKNRIAIAENFNSSKKVEVLYENRGTKFELKFTFAGEVADSCTIPKDFIEEIHSALGDLIEMKGRYRVV